MPLTKADLKADIVAILTDMMTREENSVEEFAQRLSDSIDTYVKTAKITYTSGLVAPSGPVTGTFTGKLE